MENKKQDKEGLLKFALLLSFIFAFTIGFECGNVPHKEIPVKEEKLVKDTVYVSDNRKLAEMLARELKQKRIRFVDVAVKQAKIETGNFTSEVFYENKNLFGMKEPKCRPTTSIGSKNGYAVYETYEDCIIDYAIWQYTYCRNIKTEDEYKVYISKVYAEDSNYVFKINNIKIK